MFESTGKLSIPALSFFLTALRHVSNTFVSGLSSGTNSAFSSGGSSAANNMTGQSALKMFAVERMLATLMFNVHRTISHQCQLADAICISSCVSSSHFDELFF